MTPRELIDGVAEMLAYCIATGGRVRARNLELALMDLAQAAHACDGALYAASQPPGLSAKAIANFTDAMNRRIRVARNRFDTGDKSDV